MLNTSDRSIIRTRLYLFLSERKEIVVLPVPKEETDRDRASREKKQAELDEAYIAWQMSPEVFPYDRDEVARFLNSFDWLLRQIEEMNEDELTDDAIMVPFYDAAKMAYGEEKTSIRKFFRYMYILLFHAESGPRWSQFIRATGTDYFLKLVRDKVSSFN